MHGKTRRTIRRAMGHFEALIPRTLQTSRWPRPSTPGDSRGTQWNPLGPAVRRSLVRYAGPVPSIPDMSSPVSGVDQNRCDPAGIGDIGQGPPGSRGIRPLRVLHRRDLHDREKRGFRIGKTKRGKGSKLMAVADRSGLPLAVHLTSASPHEITLVHDTLKERFFRRQPLRLIGDRAYDSDKLDAELRKVRIELISPHRDNRTRPATQDGRPLRRYRHRWKIERLFAWLQNYRRILVRYDRYSDNFLSFVHLGCMRIMLQRYF